MRVAVDHPRDDRSPDHVNDVRVAPDQLTPIVFPFVADEDDLRTSDRDNRGIRTTLIAGDDAGVLQDRVR